MGTRLLLALAVLFLGLWLVLGTTRDRFPIAGIERAGLSIRTVRHGAIPLPVESSGGVARNVSQSRVGVQYTRIENSNWVERGSFNQMNTEAHVFRVDPDGQTATQVSVRFGVIAADLIEIREGLNEGDQVIVSDMSRYENVDRVRFF